MHVIRRKPWALPERAATDETVYRNRRTLLKALGTGSLLLVAGGIPATAANRTPVSIRRSAISATVSTGL